MPPFSNFGSINPKAAIADLTRANIAAEPILKRVDWMWSEVTEGVEESKPRHVADPETGERKFVPGDIKGRAALLGVGARLLETEGKARQLPGFVANSPQSVAQTIQIGVVLPRIDDAKPVAATVDLRQADGAWQIGE